MEGYEDLWLSKHQRPITPLEGIFQEVQLDRAISIAAEQNYNKAIMRSKRMRRKIMRSKRSVTDEDEDEDEDEDISTARISYRNALLNLQATAQRLHTKATLDDIPFYQNEAEKYMKESGKKLYKLGTIGGSIRKRNKSRNKVYSAHKKSKRRRVKSTRRRHKKSTMHHRSKY